MYATEPAREALIEKLGARLGRRVSRSASIREQYGHGEAFHAPQLPDAVVFAETRDEVLGVVRLCHEYRVPVIAHGAGTSLEGNVNAVHGGICLDLQGMNRILAINEEDLDCRVQPGVSREQLNQELRHTGLFFPVDPGANASLGGMAATRASGTNAVRYGTMRSNVLGLEVVLATGQIIRTARRARKSAAGYDLTGLFVGSEGTLGVITEVSLRLHGRPEKEASAACPFDDMQGAVAAVIAIIQLGVPVARVEFMDPAQVHACNRYSGTELAELPTLLLEFHGGTQSVAEQIDVVRSLADEFGGRGFEWSGSRETESALWQARHNAYYACKALRPNADVIVTDVCVPISRLADCIVETHEDIRASALTAPIVGHVGDGNFHVCIVIDADNAAELERADAFNKRLVARALSCDGTCTGEHGIGLGKREMLIDELGEEAVGVMQSLKSTLDPRRIMNPGKIFVDAAVIESAAAVKPEASQ